MDAAEGAVDFHGLLHAILTCVTAGPGLGFNRAVLFLAAEGHDDLVAAMAIGPATRCCRRSTTAGDAILGVRTWRDGTGVKVAFSDTGAGMPADTLERLFTPFFTTKRRGTGLGLAVVKKIVDDHRGNIDVQSERGMGTTFIVTLPAAR